MTSQVTKAQLQSDLDVANARITELEAQLADQPAPRRAHLVQRIWLQGDEPRRQGTDKHGQPYCFFSGQYARGGGDNGPRIYGAYKDFTAFKSVAQAILDAYAAGDHLVEIEAYEEPKAARNEGDTRRFSDWNIVGVRVVERQVEQPAEQPLEDPTDADMAACGVSEEEVPF